MWHTPDSCVLLINIKKAYGTIVIDDLAQLNFAGQETQHLWNIIPIIYQRLLRVRMAGQLLLKARGVPQGCSMSPFLFIFCLHMAITDNNSDLTLFSKFTDFVDDIIIIDHKETITSRTLKRDSKRLAFI